MAENRLSFGFGLSDGDGLMKDLTAGGQPNHNFVLSIYVWEIEKFDISSGLGCKYCGGRSELRDSDRDELIGIFNSIETSFKSETIKRKGN